MLLKSLLSFFFFLRGGGGEGPVPVIFAHSSWWLSGKECYQSACQCRRPEFDPWVAKIPWRMKFPVFLSGKPHGQSRGSQSVGSQESDLVTKQQSHVLQHGV